MTLWVRGITSDLNADDLDVTLLKPKIENNMYTI